MNVWFVAFNWLSGWRRDLDGWLVRARRDGDQHPMFGFMEESAVAVRDHRQAFWLDRGRAVEPAGRAALSRLSTGEGE